MCQNSTFDFCVYTLLITITFVLRFYQLTTYSLYSFYRVFINDETQPIFGNTFLVLCIANLHHSCTDLKTHSSSTIYRKSRKFSDSYAAKKAIIRSFGISAIILHCGTLLGSQLVITCYLSFNISCANIDYYTSFKCSNN